MSLVLLLNIIFQQDIRASHTWLVTFCVGHNKIFRYLACTYMYGHKYMGMSVISLSKGNIYARTSQVVMPLNSSRHNGGWGMITTSHHRVIERVQSKRRLHHADSGASCGRSRYHGSSSLARSGGCELTSGRKAGERWRSETKTWLTPSCLLANGHQ